MNRAAFKICSMEPRKTALRAVTGLRPTLSGLQKPKPAPKPMIGMLFG